MSRYRKTNLNKIFKISLMIMLFAVSISSAFGLSNSVSVCPNETSGHFRCMSNVIVDTQGQPKIIASPSVGYGPNNFLAAYSLGTGTSSTNKTIAIVDAYDQPNIFSDLTTYSNNYAIPSLRQCSARPTSSLCFQKVNQTGGTSYPVYDSGWGLEISLDVEVAHAICQNCNILLVEADSNSYADLMQAFDTAAAMGADVISNSYGSSEFLGETSFDSHFNLPGKAITFSSGDSGYGATYPAASSYVTSVGGTTLQSISPHVETAWSGSGSGCSSYETKPSFQNDTGCSMRTIADVSADADPNTGAIIYDSLYGGWFQVGGTSLSAPIIAGVYALGKGFSGYGNSVPYANGSYGVNLYDITSGNNGACGGSYLCTGVPGYDGPTGLGSPKGTGAFETAQTTGLVINASRKNLAGVVVPTINITTNLGTNVTFTVTSGASLVSGATVVVMQGSSTLGTSTTNATGLATITVKAPTNATVTATASMSGYIAGTKVLTTKGDVNGDGKVSIIDALSIAQYTVGLRTVNPVVGDVNGDGKVSIIDALSIAQYTVGSRADPTTP
jgi:subtilase family serine protease